MSEGPYPISIMQFSPILAYFLICHSSSQFVFVTSNCANAVTKISKRAPPDMGLTQSRIMSRLRIKLFRLSNELTWIEKSVSILSHESIWINKWEFAWVMSWLWVNSWKSRLSHELIRFKSPRHCLSHELVQINLSEMYFSQSPQKGHTKSTIKLNAQKRSNETGNE